MTLQTNYYELTYGVINLNAIIKIIFDFNFQVVPTNFIKVRQLNLKIIFH